MAVPAGENLARHTASTTVSTLFDGTNCRPSMTARAWLLMMVPAGVGAANTEPAASRKTIRTNRHTVVFGCAASLCTIRWQVADLCIPLWLTCLAGKFVTPVSLAGLCRGAAFSGRHPGKDYWT